MGKKVIIGLILSLVSLLIFTLLETGGELTQIYQLTQPVIFSTTLIISIFLSRLRKYLIIIALVFLAFLVVTYLFKLIEISNWLGSLGFGMLLISIFSYLPQIIKDGQIDKF